MSELESEIYACGGVRRPRAENEFTLEIKPAQGVCNIVVLRTHMLPKFVFLIHKHNTQKHNETRHARMWIHILLLNIIYVRSYSCLHAAAFSGSIEPPATRLQCTPRQRDSVLARRHVLLSHDTTQYYILFNCRCVLDPVGV